jgi:hypothetical protein
LTVFEHAKPSRKEPGCGTAQGVSDLNHLKPALHCTMGTEGKHGDIHQRKCTFLRLVFSSFSFWRPNGNSGGDFFVFLSLLMFLDLGIWTRWVSEQKKKQSVSLSLHKSLALFVRFIVK